MSLCTLCSLELPKYPIIDGERPFCCSGCHAVFNILSTKNQLSEFQETSIFQQALRAGLISNPALIEKIRQNLLENHDDELQKIYIDIPDMWCPSCAEVIKLILLQQKGVKNCVVDYTTDLASVEFAPRYLSKEQIYASIAAFGYHPKSAESAETKSVSFNLYLRFTIAAFCSLNIMMFAYPLYATYFDYDALEYGRFFAWLSLFVSIPVVTYSSLPILQRFLSSIQYGLFGMEALIVMGVSSALGLSLYELWIGGTKVYFDSMTVVIVFVLLGKIIETKAKFSAKNSLMHLARAMPRRGRKRFLDQPDKFISLKEIQKGDTLVVLTGEKIVLDGIVIEGEGLCNESLITGEPFPIKKTIGSSVLSGTIIQHGWITFRVTSTQEESTLNRILEIVEQDIGHKTLYVRSVDRIICWFVPTVVFIAAITIGVCWIFGITDPGRTVLETALIRAISILLISCPCAIGIAAPLAESYLIKGLAALGAIVRNRGCLRLLGKKITFVFDKTGTITQGCFTVLDGLQDLTVEQLSVLKSLTSHSNHPIAQAIAKTIDLPEERLSRIEEFAGKGLSGIDDKNHYCLGSHLFLIEKGAFGPLLQLDCIQSNQLVSTVYFSQNGHCIAKIFLGDLIRDGAKELSKSLPSAQKVLLSGDAEFPVKYVAEVCGFDQYFWGHNPLQKRQFIENLRKQGKIICMVGDGVNDAPALTIANIGISVVSATDISIQVSDILLTTDRLQILPKMIQFAKKGQRIIHQNLFWAFVYNIVGIGLAVFGVLSPIFAAFAMMLSSLMVLFNAKRLSRDL